MVLINLGLMLVYGSVIWMHHKQWYAIPKFMLILCVSTPVFVVTGMVGLKSHLHFSLIPIAGFSVLLFDRHEKKKILSAMAYPLILLSILLATDFQLFPNHMGNKLDMLPVYDYILNFGIIFSTMFCFYRAYISAEDNYQLVHEKHLATQVQLNEERARSIYSSKMAALGEMAGGIAHEINSPLFVIKSLCYKLHIGLPDKSLPDEKILEYTNTIQETCTKIGSIVRSLTTISRSGENDPIENINIKSLIDDTMMICHHRYYLKSIELEIDCQEGIPEVSCRQVEIGQVLINLLNNAYDAVADVPKPKVALKVKCLEDEVAIMVEDNGPGIPPAISHRIFETFYTTKEIGKGTGLGLSISRRIAESNGGSLNFESVPGKTTFTIKLPITTYPSVT